MNVPFTVTMMVREHISFKALSVSCCSVLDSLTVGLLLKEFQAIWFLIRQYLFGVIF